MALWFMAIFMMASNFGLQNGDFRTVEGGKAVGWEISGQGRVLPNGGHDGMPAMVVDCTDGSRSFANQNLHFDTPRRGSFTVSAWVYIDESFTGSECSVWLDVLQKDADPLWGIRGFAVPEKKGWQLVKSVVKPTHPVTDIQIYLMQSGNGKARFSDIRIADVPFLITDFRAKQGPGGSIDVRAGINDQVDWQVTASQVGKEVWSKSGSGTYISESIRAEQKSPVEVKLIASLNGRTQERALTIKPDADKAFDWWVESSMTRVFQDDILPSKPAKSIRLKTARNDRESFQVCLRALSDGLRNISASISDLQSGDNVIPKAQTDWKRVGYVYVENTWPHPYSPRGSKSWWPDPLLAACAFDVEAGRTQPLWFTVNVPEGVVPGTYKGEVTVTADGMKPLRIPISLDVSKAAIPVQGRMKTAFACMDAFLTKLYGGISPGLRRSYTDFLLQNRLNPDDISRTTPPDIDELRYANTRGLNAFNILNVVPERDKSEVPLHTYPSIWICYAPVEAYTPRFKQEFIGRLDKIVPELEKYGLLDKAYIYGFDERGPEYIPIIQDLFGEIKNRYPRIHTLSTCWPPAGTDPQSLNIDWYVPLSSSYNPELAKQVRARGDEMWWYVCLGPRYPYANWMLENPLIEARLIWWQAFDYDVEGMLYWIVNLWDLKDNDAPIKDTAGPRIDWSVTSASNVNGDGVLLYPGENGPIGSIRLANIRDGLEDTEILYQYKQRFGEESTKKMLKRVTTDRTEYSRNPSDLAKARNAMLDALDR